jgi:hypothetical protein
VVRLRFVAPALEPIGRGHGLNRYVQPVVTRNSGSGGAEKALLLDSSQRDTAEQGQRNLAFFFVRRLTIHKQTPANGGIVKFCNRRFDWPTGEGGASDKPYICLTRRYAAEKAGACDRWPSAFWACPAPHHPHRDRRCRGVLESRLAFGPMRRVEDGRERRHAGTSIDAILVDFGFEFRTAIRSRRNTELGDEEQVIGAVRNGTLCG